MPGTTSTDWPLGYPTRIVPWRRCHRRRDDAAEQCRDERGDKEHDQIIADPVEHRRGGRVRRRWHRSRRRRTSPEFPRRSDLASGLDDPEPRQQRHQHRDDKREPAQQLVPAPHAQPEMQAEHRVAPRDKKDELLPQPDAGCLDEIDPQQIRIISGIGAEPVVADAGAHDMAHQQQRDRKAERQLRPFGRKQPQRAALPQRAQRQKIMDCETAVEQHLHRRQRPERGEKAQPLRHRRQRHQTDRMVQQVRRDIGQHEQPGGEPQPTAHVQGLRRPADAVLFFLFAAGGRDHLAQRVDADGARHDLVADHEAGVPRMSSAAASW